MKVTTVTFVSRGVGRQKLPPNFSPLGGGLTKVKNSESFFVLKRSRQKLANFHLKTSVSQKLMKKLFFRWFWAHFRRPLADGNFSVSCSVGMRRGVQLQSVEGT
jgi:hypothetical protein